MSGELIVDSGELIVDSGEWKVESGKWKVYRMSLRRGDNWEGDR